MPTLNAYYPTALSPEEKAARAEAKRRKQQPSFTVPIGAHGPICEVAIRAPGAEAYIAAKALIDTGASGACIRPGRAAVYGLKQLSKTASYTGYDGEQKNAAFYEGEMLIATRGRFDLPPTLGFTSLEFCEFNHVAEPWDVVIGRDILKYFTFVYSGRHQTLTLTLDKD